MKDLRTHNEIPVSQLFEIGETFLQKFNSVIKHSNFYPENHPILKESINNFRDFLKDIFHNFGRLHINIYEGEIYLFNRFIPGLGKFFVKFANFLESRKINEISILPESPKGKFTTLQRPFPKNPKSLKRPGEFRPFFQTSKSFTFR